MISKEKRSTHNNKSLFLMGKVIFDVLSSSGTVDIHKAQYSHLLFLLPTDKSCIYFVCGSFNFCWQTHAL